LGKCGGTRLRRPFMLAGRSMLGKSGTRGSHGNKYKHGKVGRLRDDEHSPATSLARCAGGGRSYFADLVVGVCWKSIFEC
jgi:hypothetical protein